MMRARPGVMVIGAALLGWAALPALAALGGDISSVASDRVQMKAQSRGVSSGTGFTVHEIEAPSGTLVREYVSASGKVFAVSWRGPSKPDLRELFGSYFQQYVDASRDAQHGPATRRHFQVRRPDLVVQSNGRMRAFYGRAYVPSLMPAGVSASDIR